MTHVLGWYIHISQKRETSNRHLFPYVIYKECKIVMKYALTFTSYTYHYAISQKNKDVPEPLSN